jgi:hypothetical protein
MYADTETPTTTATTVATPRDNTNKYNYDTAYASTPRHPFMTKDKDIE